MNKNDKWEQYRLAANTVRFLAADGVQKANSGHPGLPMGMADCATVLWTKFLKFNPQKPGWLNRDRFVLSAGHGSMLLYSLLYLSGYNVTLDDLKSFRQWGSRTPGHPELGCLPGVETTTGPLGQGFANGIGMAIAEKMMAQRFNSPDFSLLNHNIFAIVSDGDLMEGVSFEAASLAGHLKLGNVVYLYDNNNITIEGNTSLAFSENVAQRFDALGWHTIAINGHNYDEIEGAIQAGIDETEKPTLILAKTHIAFGSPNLQDSEKAHGSPLGEDELKAAKRNLGFPENEKFYVPKEAADLFRKRVSELVEIQKNWQEKFFRWQDNNPDQAQLLDKMISKSVPDDLAEQLIAAIPERDLATRASSGKILQKAAELVPGLIGGSADLSPSTKTWIDDAGAIEAYHFSGRNFHFGIREHGMGGILNGIAEYGGWIPFGSTFLVFSDYMRPPIRIAALSELQTIYVFTHDSIFVGEDGPTHQPVEHLAALRAIPNLVVFRPADSLEVAMGWNFALKHRTGPTALILTRQTLPNLKRTNDFQPEDVLRGGYILSPESEEKLDGIIVATGSEVHIAVEAQKILQEKGKPMRVVSIPSLEIFAQQSAAYRDKVLPANVPVFAVEVAVSFGWHGVAPNSKVKVIGIDRFGASAPYKILAEKFGFTGEKVAEKILSWM
ncbi:MAG: transketolase [Calditrichaeota bacterium]|nr:transketolase [Calditrichota bacterium]